MNKRLMKLAGLLKEDFELPDESPFELPKKEKEAVDFYLEEIWEKGTASQEQIIEDLANEANDKEEIILNINQYIEEAIHTIFNEGWLGDDMIEDWEGAKRLAIRITKERYMKEVEESYKEYVRWAKKFIEEYK